MFAVGSRYFALTAIAWLIWYVLFRKRLAPGKLQPAYPKKSDYRREISYSLITILIFGTYPTIFLLTPIRQYTQYYSNIGDHGMLWFWLAFPIIFLVHDTYFYWTHRLIHHPKLFRIVHLVHHKSTNPSPWAAFSFHPLEAILEGGIFVVLVFCMPMHAIHHAVFFVGQISYNIYGHLGWELYPAGFEKTWIGRWINTSRVHNEHHQFFKGNYGLYFLWWDRWCGTMRVDPPSPAATADESAVRAAA